MVEKYTAGQQDRNDNRSGMVFTVRYYVRGKCSKCDDPMWTTDKGCSVVCVCGSSRVRPTGLEGDAVDLTDAEHEAYVRTHRPYDPAESVKFVRLA